MIKLDFRIRKPKFKSCSVGGLKRSSLSYAYKSIRKECLINRGLAVSEISLDRQTST